MDKASLDRITRLAFATILVGMAVLAIKALAFFVTGSVALYSDALESTVNVATAVAAFTAVRLSAVPPDANHPYGHHKAEYLSAVLEGVLIVGAAAVILYESVEALRAPRPLDAPWLGLAINAAGGLVNGVWWAVLSHYGRKWSSPALVADAEHLFADVVTSVGVVAGVAAAQATGWLQLDPLIAALVAANILWSGWKLMRRSIGGLMDEAAPDATLARIRGLIADHADGALEAHDLRTRHAGRMTFLDFHLVVPGTMTVAQSHDICDRIEGVLRSEIDHLVVTIHVEPEHKAKHTGKIAVI